MTAVAEDWLCVSESTGNTPSGSLAEAGRGAMNSAIAVAARNHRLIMTPSDAVDIAEQRHRAGLAEGDRDLRHTSVMGRITKEEARPVDTGIVVAVVVEIRQQRRVAGRSERQRQLRRAAVVRGVAEELAAAEEAGLIVAVAIQVAQQRLVVGAPEE